MTETEQTTEQSAGGAPEAPAAEAAAGPAPAGRNRRKSREGVVVVTEQVRHRRYNKTVRRHKRLYVHDENNDLRVGDKVRISETRPMSKLKRWRLVQILERAR